MESPASPPDPSSSKLGDTHSPFFAAWARVVIRHRFLMIAATVGLTVMFGYVAATRLRLDMSHDAFVARDSETARVLREVRDDFGVDGVTLVVIEGDVFSPPFLAKLRALHGQLANLDLDLESLGDRPSRDSDDATAAQAAGAVDDFGDFGDEEGWGDEQGGSIIDEITSLINVRQTLWVDEGLQVRGLLDTWPTDDELPALERRVLADDTLVGKVINAAGTHTTIMLRLGFMNQFDMVRVHAEINRIIHDANAPGFEGLMGGAHAQEAAINELVQLDLARLGGFGLLLMLLIMGITFRHPIGVLGPIFVVIQAVVWTFGIMASADVAVNMLSNILPMFTVCVGIGDSVHIQSVYRDGRGRGLDNDAAIERALAVTGMPVLFTTLTTCAGLLSFRFASMEAIQQMGTFGALAVASALLISLVFLPAFLTFNRTSLLGLRRKQGRDQLDRMLDFCNKLSAPGTHAGSRGLRGRNATLLIAVALSAAAVVGGSLLRVYHNPISWIPDDYEIKRAFTALDTKMGGSADLTLLIDAREGGTMRDRKLMVGLEKLEAHIKAYEHPGMPSLVGQVTSIVDVIRESNRATHENDPAFYRLPDSERGIGDMLTMFENAGPEQLRRLATVDLKRSIMIVRVKWLEASGYAPLVAHIEKGIDQYLGDEYVVRPTGSVVSMLTFVGALVSVLLNSFGIAFIFITVMMVVILRDIRLGVLSMVPNVLPIGVVIGIMGFFGIPIDLNTLLLAPIALGIAVDDSIHFLHQFRVHREAHGDVEAAIDHTFDHAGRAIVTTSVILVSGFFIFVLAHMINLIQFGLLLALTLLLAVIVDLIFTPALLRAVYGGGRRAESDAGTG